MEFVKSLIKPMAKEQAVAAAVADLTITCFFAMLTGWPLAHFLNLFFRKERWLRNAMKKDQIEAFLLNAAEKESSIAVTMDDQKVYVGYVVSGFDPTIGRKCIQILPLMSGYRDDETHKVRFTTFYGALYGHDGSANQTMPLPAPLGHLNAEDFITLLPVDRIASYRMFDSVAYRVFQNAKQSGTQSQSTSGSVHVGGAASA